MDQRARGRIAEGEEGVRDEGRARCLCLLKGQPGRQLASSRELTSDSAPEHTSRNRGGARGIKTELAVGAASLACRLRGAPGCPRAVYSNPLGGFAR